MSLKIKKGLSPIRDEFKSASQYEREEILAKVRLANRIIDEDLKKGKYDKSMKEKIKKESSPFRELERDLEKEMK